MLGLVPLEHVLHPETTVDKILFLLENGFENFNPITTFISFSALAALILLRIFKSRLTKYWFIHRLPEVLVVVAVSTILSAVFRWDEDGVDILGEVSIKTGGSFIQLPFQSSNIKYLRRTTSTAV